MLNRLPRSTRRLLVVVTALCALSLAGASLAQDTSRKVVAKTAPTFPELAKRMHLTGKVKVEIVITADGSVSSAKLVGGSPIFEKNAIDAVKQWKFEPADKEAKATVFVEFAGQ